MSATHRIGPSMRMGWLLGFAACAAIMAYVLYVQYSLFISPCPLCIFQRIAVIAMGIFFLVGGLHQPKGLGRRFYAGLVALAGCIGIAVAGRHLWLQSLPADEVPACGPGLGYMLDTFPLAETLKLVLTGSGECAETHWSFLGMSMPAWSLICMLILVLWALWTARRPQPANLLQ